MKERILIVEDNQDMLEWVEETLRTAGYETSPYIDARQAVEAIGREADHFDLIVTDVRMPGVTGINLLEAARQSRPEAPVIITTAYATVEQAVELMKLGAAQYLTKPFTARDLLQAAENALAKSAPQREQARLRRELPKAPVNIIGASRPMRRLFDLLDRAARSSSSVLITGESGTGKELVARALYQQSGRAGEFIALNCAAVPSELIESELFGHTSGAFTGATAARTGMFEAADKGVLFFDEIGELPLPLQPKLLRALQEGKVRRIGADRERDVDVRVIAATNRELEIEVKEGRFREDLYWRLNVIPIHLPPLRERSIDIPLLVDHFITRAAKLMGASPLEITPEALATLVAYRWPGNVRELENAMERALVLAKGARITLEDLPERIISPERSSQAVARSRVQKPTLRDFERDYILETLRETGGNKQRAAELLGLDRKTLYRKLEEYRDSGYLAEREE